MHNLEEFYLFVIKAIPPEAVAVLAVLAVVMMFILGYVLTKQNDHLIVHHSDIMLEGVIISLVGLHYIIISVYPSDFLRGIALSRISLTLLLSLKILLSVSTLWAIAKRTKVTNCERD